MNTELLQDIAFLVEPSSRGGNENDQGTTGKELSSEDTFLAFEEENDKVTTTSETKSLVLDIYVAECIKRDLASYNGFKIRETYPKAFKKLHDYSVEKAGINAPPEGIDQDTVCSILLYSSRTILFDFFDTNQIYVNISRNRDSGIWNYYIQYDKDNYIESITGHDKRTPAEVDAYYKAFEILESKLK